MVAPSQLFKNREVLLLDDDLMLRRRLEAFFTRKQAEVSTAGTLEEARNLLAALPFDFALIDVNLPDGLGLDLLREGAFSSNTLVLVMTADGGVETAVEAMRLGAHDYLAKPFDPNELPLIFGRNSRQEKSRRVENFRQQAEAEKTQGTFFFGSFMAGFQQQLERILLSDRRLEQNLPPVLIEGETGTGKTTLARYIHQSGPRADAALVEVNCSALPESLAESELFGHERGAFTDAKSARIGLFEAADGGTLFLDEIPSLSLPLQAKVLTAIEDGKIRRVGGNKPIQIDTRIIAATNMNLQTQIKEGAFREDLYHRLDLLRLQIPPLRERRQDIQELANRMLIQLAAKYRVAVPEISAEGLHRLQTYPWPGNVRELLHECERVMILGFGDSVDFERLTPQPTGEPSLTAELAPAHPDQPWFNAAFSFPESGFDIEAANRFLIERALEQTGGNVSKAARLLGVNRDYIRYRIK